MGPSSGGDLEASVLRGRSVLNAKLGRGRFYPMNSVGEKVTEEKQD